MSEAAQRLIAEALRRDIRCALHIELVLEGRELLGEGGMGRVLRVIDRRLDRPAALKLLQSEASAEPREVERFLREARIMAQLDHPSIPAVYEAGLTASQQAFLLMRLIDGQTLAELLPRRPTRLLLEALAQACEAVAYAHSQGIIHRDLKPSNIMVGAFGEVQVMDWGLARRLEGPDSGEETLPLSLAAQRLRAESEQRGLTLAGAIVGTPGYMPPEQAAGQEVTGAADVFALGSILTELLTGEPAVAGGSAIVRLMGTLDGRIAAPRDRSRSAARELDSLARAALSQEPEARPSAAAFAAELRRYLRGERLETHRYGLLARALRLSRRHPGPLLGLVAAALALGLLAYERGQTRLAELEASVEAERREAAEAAQARLEAEAAARERADEAMLQARAAVARGAEAARVRAHVALALEAAPASPVRRLEAARLLFQAGALEGADALAEEVAQSAPPGYDALLLRHEIALRRAGRRNLMTAPLLELLRRSRTRGEVTVATRLADALKALSEGDHEAAVRIYDALEAESNRILPLYINRGFAYTELGRFAEAERDFDRAIDLAPREPAAWHGRGAARGRLGRLDGAIADFTESLALDPENLLSLTGRAVAYAKLGRLKESLADLDRAVEMAPRSALALKERALTRIALNDLEGALTDLARAVALAPEAADIHVHHAQALRRAGRFAEALLACEAAQETGYDPVEVELTRARILLESNNPKAALSATERAIAADPEAATPWMAKAAVLERLGRSAEARAAAARGQTLAAREKSQRP